MKQLNLLAKEPNAYGGELLRKRKGRIRARPLATKHTMHLVMRSSRATGEWSFRRTKHRRNIDAILTKFSRKYAVKVHSFANVGNHLHLHIQLGYRAGYKPFIRATTAAIAMAVTGRNRWTKKFASPSLRKFKFWDYRPYSRVVLGFKALLGLRDYIRINQLEGFGYDRREAVYLVKQGTPLLI